jgi:hypothetical protein
LANADLRLAERVTITVRPSAAHPNVLTVQDAMRQVLDFFELLTPEEQGFDGLLWNLKTASTNSPLTVIGEAVCLVPSVDVTMIARVQGQIVAEQLKAFTSGVKPKGSISKRQRETYKRIFSRNTNGIGQTDASFWMFEEPIRITPKTASVGIDALAEEDKEFDSFLLRDRGREEIGSIEGTLLEVGTDYNQPAILVRERKTGKEIWCRVDAELKHKISEESRFEDVWDRRRVVVSGRVCHDSSGIVTRVRATSVRTLQPRTMTVHDIRDPDFTGGLSIKDYLDHLREGDIGE